MTNVQSKYMQQVGIDWKDGRARIRWLSPDAEARKYGLSEGDLIRTVNGTQLRSITDVMRVGQDLLQKDEFVVGLESGGRSRTLRFKVQKRR